MVSIIFSNSHKYIYIWKYFKEDYTIFYIYVYFNNWIYFPALNNGTSNYTLTGPNQDHPGSTIWSSILSMYYLNTNNLYNYSDDIPFILFILVANVIIVLILLNMIIALMK
jgi:hypothetical protein